MLHVAKGNMYDFITHTWNAIKGKCPIGCQYCYMKRYPLQREMYLDRKEFSVDLGKDNFIFVGSSFDMFTIEVPADWVYETLNHCNRFTSRYLFQSKMPVGFSYYLKSIPPNSYAGTTIETNRESLVRTHSKAPSIEGRVNGMSLLKYTRLKKFVTIEPIMDFDVDEFSELLKRCNPEFVAIGADSGNNNLSEPPYEKVLELVEKIKTFSEVRYKVNLDRLKKD